MTIVNNTITPHPIRPPQSWDVGTRQLVSSGPVPLSPKATLQWAGFTEEGLLAIYDSTGVGRVRAEDWGGQASDGGLNVLC